MKENIQQTGIEQENREILYIAFWAFVLNLLLAVIKGWLAYRSSSLAITAGAIDSATDSFASLAVFAGLFLSTRKTRNFPLGLYKIENLISVVIAFFIFFAGYEIAKQLISPPSRVPDIALSHLWWIWGATLATFLFGEYAAYHGKKTESPTIIAEGRHRQVDVLSSLVVLVSVLLNYYDIRFQYHYLTIDRISAFLVLLFIIQAGWELLSDGMRVLLDASIDHETLNRARKIVESQPAVKEVTSLVGRSAGRFRFLYVEVVIRTRRFKKAHDISHRIEKEIREQIPHVKQVHVHYAPSQSEILRMGLPVLEDGESICGHFGDAPGFVLLKVNPRTCEILEKTELKNPNPDTEKGKGLKAARFLVSHNIDLVVAKKDISESGPGYVFADAGVDIQKTEKETVSAAFDEICEKA